VSTGKQLTVLCTAHPILFGWIKSRRTWLEGHVARMGEGRGVYRVWVGKTEGKETTWETQA